MASAKGNTSCDWGKGFASGSCQKVCTIVPQNHFGPIPGVEVGTLWKFQRQASEVGVHRPHVAGIHGRENKGAYSIVLSGSYKDDEDNGDSFTYTGSGGGSDFSGNKRTAEQLCDHQLTRMNRALAMNCNAPINTSGTEAKDWKGGKPVRVIRNAKGRKHSRYAPEDGNRYDGIYKIVKYWQAKGKSGFKVWRYLLQRDDPTPAPWTEEGKKRIEQLGLTMQYPEGYLAAQEAKEEAAAKEESDLDQNDTRKMATKDKTKKRKRSLDNEAERSVNVFSEAQPEGDSKVLKDGAVPEVVVTYDSKLKSVSEEGIVTEEAPQTFCFITWNIDGLDEKTLQERTEAVARTIEKEKADIVFLQEVIPTTCQYLKGLLPQYTFLTGNTEDYFTVTLLHCTTVHFDGQTVVPFNNTVMGRNLLCVEAHIGDLKLHLLNAHLESTGEFTSQRVEQLKLGFGKMKGSPADVTTIFAGDLNLRDKEVVEAGLPPDVVDVWEACGKGTECRYTWDTTCNTNKEFPGRFKPRLRFDRVYLRTPTSPTITTALPRHFGLVGLEKVTNTQSFPSDHWGIIIHYETLTEEKKQMKELMGFSSFHTTKGKNSYSLWGVTCSDGKKREDLPDFEEYNKWQMRVK